MAVDSGGPYRTCVFPRSKRCSWMVMDDWGRLSQRSTCLCLRMGKPVEINVDGTPKSRSSGDWFAGSMLVCTGLRSVATGQVLLVRLCAQGRRPSVVASGWRGVRGGQRLTRMDQPGGLQSRGMLAGGCRQARWPRCPDTLQGSRYL